MLNLLNIDVQMFTCLKSLTGCHREFNCINDLKKLHLWNTVTGQDGVTAIFILPVKQF